jgi:SseB protein N-terminal domain
MPPSEVGPETLLLALLAEDDVPIPREQVAELEEELELALVATELEDGRQALLAFTSEEELREWRPQGGSYAEMRAADLLPLAFAAGNHAVLVNPASARVLLILGDEQP